jgi:hypothetical protein
VAHSAVVEATAPVATPTTPPFEEAAPAQAGFNGLQLPLSVVGPVDLGRLLRELEAIDADLMEQAIKKQELILPKLSKLLDNTASLNKVTLTDETHRATLIQALTACKAHAPLLHMSFSADPSPLFIEKLMAWLRTNIDPVVLLTVGLQPNLGAGCLIRSTNKYFDFSLRENFTKNRDLLMSKLKEQTS